MYYRTGAQIVETSAILNLIFLVSFPTQTKSLTLLTLGRTPDAECDAPLEATERPTPDSLAKHGNGVDVVIVTECDAEPVFSVSQCSLGRDPGDADDGEFHQQQMVCLPGGHSRVNAIFGMPGHILLRSGQGS